VLWADMPVESGRPSIAPFQFSPPRQRTRNEFCTCALSLRKRDESASRVVEKRDLRTKAKEFEPCPAFENKR
jgi:hypothetical protein